MELIVVGFLVIIDIVTGFIKAWKTKSISSGVIRKGLSHKIGEIAALLFCWVLQYGGEYVGVGVSTPLVLPAACYIGTMEITSIIENLCEINPKLHALFSGRFARFAKSKNKGGENDDNDNA